MKQSQPGISKLISAVETVDGCGQTRVVHLLHHYSKQLGLALPRELQQKALSNKRAFALPTARRSAVPQLTSTEVDEIVARYKVTRNIRQVARDLGRSRTTVAKHLSSRGIDTSKSMKPGAVRIAAELYEQGLSSGAIGAKLEFDNHTILAALRRSGIRVRAR